MSLMKTALWQAVKEARPNLTDKEVDDLLVETAKRERRLVLYDKIPLDKAREIIREELFPPDLDPWAGDEKYGPPR